MRDRQGDLDAQIAEVRKALDHLTPDQRTLLSGSEDYGDDVVIPAGNLGGIIQFAMSQMGKPYLWGAVGPGLVRLLRPGTDRLPQGGRHPAAGVPPAGDRRPGGAARAGAAR